MSTRRSPAPASKLDEIKARWATVAEEPWKCTAGGAVLDALDRRIALLDGEAVEHPYLRAETAKAIAAAPDDVAWLVGEVERLREALEDLHTEAQSVASDYDCDVNVAGDWNDFGHAIDAAGRALAGPPGAKEGA